MHIMTETEQILTHCLPLLRRGGTLLYPTDTIWGVGCDAAQPVAIRKLYAIKQRDAGKSMLVLVDNRLFAELTATLHQSIQALAYNSERPTTLIFPQGMNVVEQLLERELIHPSLLADDGSIGIRIPKHSFCQALLQQLERPLVSSSANLSGEPAPRCYEEITDAVRQRVDYCVPNRPTFAGSSHSSRILKLSPQGNITVIRD